MANYDETDTHAKHQSNQIINPNWWFVWSSLQDDNVIWFARSV